MKAADSLKVLKALADSSRLSIMQSIIEKPQYVEELSQRFNLAASTVSFHLKKLEEAKLIHKRKEQYYVVFHPNINVFNKSIKELITFENKEKRTQEDRISQYKLKVINTYFKEGKLIKIPSQHKKRWIILEKIARDLEDKKVYSEKELNNKISEFFDDYCTIRRYLVDEKILERHNGEYRKNHESLNSSANQETEEKVLGLEKSFLDSVKSL